MQHMLKGRQGFALPTILIASVIMLTVLMSAITAVSSITGGINSQYYNQLAREAAESGLARAESCLRLSNYDPTWTDALPLKPDKDCNGVALAGGNQWVVSTTNVRTTFTVARPAVGTLSSLRIIAVGTVELLRTSDPNAVWRTYTATVTKNSRYNDMPQIAGGAGWKESGHNGYMLAATGVLYGWGDNTSQQLGDTSLGTLVSTPVKIVLPTGMTKAKKVFNSGQGASILCILGTVPSLNDQVYCRGLGMGLGGQGWVRVALSAGLTAIDAVVNGWAGDNVCVVASDQQAYCVGDNALGNLGNGITNGVAVSMAAPTRFRLDLANPGPPVGTTLPLTVKKVFTQDFTTCVVASDDRPYCAGENNWGQLGQGNHATDTGFGKSTPGRALIPGDLPVDDIRMAYHGGFVGTFFHTTNDFVYMSGHNGQGTANDGIGGFCSANGGGWNCYSTPRVISSADFKGPISVGERGDHAHSICIVSTTAVSDSGLWCIGRNTYGQLGAGNCTTQPWYFGPSNVGGQVVKSAINKEANYQMNSVMVITVSGDVYATGDNTYGKLGTGAPLQECNSTFTKVQLPAGVKATALANGDEYSAFILGDNGKVYAMGRNHNGQLGDGTTTNRSLPVEVKIPRQQTVY